MLNAKWFEEIPCAAAVFAHESDHPRPDGIRLGRITLSRETGPVGGEYIKCDDRSYGEWVCYHDKSRLQPYVSVIRLKAVNGEVLMEVGFTSWLVLSECQWANECRYYPVGQDGLPIGFEVK